MGLQHNVTLLLRRVDTRHCGARRRAELARAAAAQATHQWGSVTQSSSCLLAGASIVDAHRLGGACVELDGAGGG
jgi:hypothetical protein